MTLPKDQNWPQVKTPPVPRVCTTGPSLISPCHKQVWWFLCLLGPTAPTQTPGFWHSFPSVVTMGVWRNVSVLILSDNRSVVLNWQIYKMWRGRTTDKTLFGEEDSEVSVVESLLGDLRCTAGGLGMTGGSCCGAETCGCGCGGGCEGATSTSTGVGVLLSDRENMSLNKVNNCPIWSMDVVVAFVGTCLAKPPVATGWGNTLTDWTNSVIPVPWSYPPTNVGKGFGNHRASTGWCKELWEAGP